MITMKTLNVKDETKVRVLKLVGQLQRVYGKKFTVDDALNSVITTYEHMYGSLDSSVQLNKEKNKQ